MNYQDRYNSERYLDMTAYLALRNIERKERRHSMKEDWIYRRGDVYLANLDPFIGSEQGGTRPVVVLQNNTGNFYCPTLIIAGSADRTVGNDAAPALHAGIAGSVLYVYEGLGHGVYEEAKDFYDRVLNFCNQ